MASYPSQAITFTDKVNTVDVIDATHPNLIQDEVVAIENILGSNPHISTAPSPTGAFTPTSYTFSTLTARLANIETGIVSDAHTQYVRKTSDSSNTITAGSASTKGLILKGAASQTANLQEWQVNGSTTPVTYVDSTGVLITTAPTNVGAVRTTYISSSAPSGGNDGDVWLKYS